MLHCSNRCTAAHAAPPLTPRRRCPASPPLQAHIVPAPRVRSLSAPQLLDYGVSPDTADYDNRAALHLAAAVGNFEVVVYLSARKANINILDRWGGTPLEEAIRGGHQVAPCIHYKTRDLKLIRIPPSTLRTRDPKPMRPPGSSTQTPKGSYTQTLDSKPMAACSIYRMMIRCCAVAESDTAPMPNRIP